MYIDVSGFEPLQFKLACLYKYTGSAFAQNAELALVGGVSICGSDIRKMLKFLI